VRSERRTDYREVLSEPDFAVFARLRILRKQVAEAEAVPPTRYSTTSTWRPWCASG
jgi:superfamily II DNA helicase RecQ